MKYLITAITAVLFVTANLFAQDAREYFKFAKHQFDNGAYPESLEFINKAIGQDNSYLNAYFLRAQIYLELGQHYSSMLDLNHILDTDRSENSFTGQCYLVRGRCYMAIKKYARAMDDLNTAQRFTKDNPEVLYYQAMLSLQMEDSDKALEYIEGAIQRKADALYFGLMAEIKMEKFRDARESKAYRSVLNDINKAISLDQDNYEFYLIRSKYLNSLGNLDKAMMDYDRMIELSPEKDMAYANRGIAKLNKNDYQGAIVDFTKSIGINPGNPEAYRHRGLCYNNLNNYRAASKDFTKSIDILSAKISESANEPTDTKRLAETYLMRGHSRNLMGSETQACRDFLIAYELGINKGLNYYRKFCSIY